MKYGNAVQAWLALAAAISGVCMLLYAAVQQNYRQSLNDPQIQIAEDTAAALSRGAGIENALWREMPLLVSTSSQAFIDIAESLSPWTAYYAPDGTPLESTGLLEGALPGIPKGVLEAARTGKGKDSAHPDENRITWQPQEGVREALVVVSLQDQSRGIGFVVSGRNMREVEDRESRLRAMVFFGWLVLMIGTLALQIVGTYRRS